MMLMRQVMVWLKPEPAKLRGSLFYLMLHI